MGQCYGQLSLEERVEIYRLQGGVENSIGRLRRSLPRKTDLNLITAADLKRHIQRLNDTPRKCLDFSTPAEAFSKLKEKFSKLKSIVALQT
jgi:transposase, IS30 family